MKLKLKHYLVILLGLPLLFQISSGCFLFEQLKRLDSAAQRESQAKAVITTCQEMRVSISKLWLWAGAQRFMKTEDTDSIKIFAKSLDKRIALLHVLVNDDPDAERTVKSYEHELREMKEILKDATVRFEDEKGSEHRLARFVSEAEFLEELFVRTGAIFRYEQQLIAHYKPLVAEFSPKARQEREYAMKIIQMVMVLNMVLACVLAALFWKFMIVRMNLLMNNIVKFSEGQTDLDTVGGEDEITDIDRRFRTMALARHYAEEMRRSIQAMVSHDLKSPLTAVSLTLSLVLEKYDLSAEVRRQLERLSSQVTRLVKLAESFLDLEKLQSGKMELDLAPHNLSHLLEESKAAVESLLDRRKLKIVSNIVGTDTSVLDGERITQVLINLLSNAVKYSPIDGTIEISVKNEAPNGPCRFEVIDQGTGVPPEKQDALFKRFSTLEQSPDSQLKSSGLGLYICKLLVDAHHGTIGYRTPPSGGSCFWFEIPGVQ